MVTSNRTASKLMIIVQPNRSANWQTNQLLLLALAVPSLGIATGFALAGAWVILPFAGLELTALGFALYKVSWQLQYRHIITVSSQQVRIEKGFFKPETSWNFSRPETGLTVSRQEHPLDSPRLYLHNRKEQVSIGEFLNQDDSLTLLRLLRGEVRIDGDSPSSTRSI